MPKNKSITTTSGLSSNLIDAVRRRAYRTINPLTDYNITKNLKEFVNGRYMDYGNVIRDGNKYLTEFGDGMTNIGTVDDIWATYLQIPKNKRRFSTRIGLSSYKPKQGDKNKTYYKLPLTNKDKQYLIEDTNNLPLNKNKLSTVLSNYNLATHTVSRGIDKKGEYRSYYDVFDINPFTGKYDGTKLPILNKLNDATLGIGKPVNIYDRIYLDDYYGIPKNKRIGAAYLPEVKIVGTKKKK